MGATLNTCGTTTYTTTQTDLDSNRTITNTAVGHGYFGATQVNSTTVTVNVTPIQNRAITVTKSASPTTYSTVGTVIVYSYVLRNTGNVTLAAPFTVTDDKASPTCPGTPASIAPNGTITCTASHIVTQADLDTGSVVNTASGHAHFGAATINSASTSATATAVQNRAITVTKTPEPHLLHRGRPGHHLHLHAAEQRQCHPREPVHGDRQRPRHDSLRRREPGADRHAQHL